MSLKIRLARGGSKKRPSYRIVVADSRARRDGRFIEKLGVYNPTLPGDHAMRFQIDTEKAAEWMKKGAQPTDRVARFLGQAGVVEWKAGNNPTKGVPGQKAKERAEERAQREADKAAALAEAAAAPAVEEAPAAAEEAPAAEAAESTEA